RARRGRDVVLERMHELVPEHVIRLGKSAGKRQDDAAAVALGDTPCAFADVTEDVGLLKMRMCGVQNERLPATQVVPEQPRQSRMPALSHARREANRGFFLEVVVDV